MSPSPSCMRRPRVRNLSCGITCQLRAERIRNGLHIRYCSTGHCSSGHYPAFAPFLGSYMYSSHLQAVLMRLKGINRELNNLEALAAIAEVQSRPSHLEVDFSSRCNYRCPMCHQSKFDMGRVALDRTQIDTLVDSLPYVDTVMIAGLGEPLLYPGLGRFLPWLQRYGCHAHLFTNGELIDRRIEWLRDLDRISVSLDGATADTFETLRRGGHFERVVSNIRTLRAAAPQAELVTSTVVSRLNLREIADIVALADSLGMDEVHLSPVDHTPSLELGEEDAPVFAEQLAQALVRRGRVRIINNLQPWHFLPGRNSRVAEADLLKASDAQVLPAAQALETWSEHGGDVPQGFIHGMDAKHQLAELDRRLRTHTRALGALRKRIRRERIQLALPYCSAVWKYGFARSRGDARLCPYADVGLGAVESVLAQPYNTPLLVDLRRSMGEGQPALSVCRGCTDDHRQFRRHSLQSSLDAASAAASESALGRLRRTLASIPR